MSTRILNAFRIKMRSAVATRTFMEQFRAAALPMMKAMFADRMAKDIATTFDRLCCGRPVEPEMLAYSPLTGAWEYARAQFDKVRRTQHRNPSYDFDCTLNLIPHRDGYCYVQLFTEQKAYLDIVKDLGCEDYSYWDGCDGPDEFSAAAWRARGKKWDAVAPTGVPANHGWSTDLLGTYGFVPYPSKAAILAAIPGLDDRVKHIAGDLVIDAHVQAQNLDQEAKRDIWRAIMDAADWVRTEPGQQFKNAVADIVRQRLLPAIGEEEIKGWPDAQPALTLPPLQL